MKNIAVIGSSGALGKAFIEQLALLYPDATVHGFSRRPSNVTTKNVVNHLLEYEPEDSVERASLLASQSHPLDLVIVATGMLHDGAIMPEKSLRDISSEKFMRLYQVNAVFPALVAKHFLPHLRKDNRCVFAVLSARVGSISDNQLGGWYAYRASKAALNMIVKNAAIEVARRNKQAVIVGLHPGTVESSLSKPFQANVPGGKLFSPEFSAEKMIQVLLSIGPEHSGKCFAWDGNEIEP
jgi:NAD(P)-dependent dehydrogenase (short-subunit alcohol dehydrogenase family)